MSVTDGKQESWHQDWHHHLTSQKERLGFLLEKEEMADVIFIFGEKSNEKTIPAHKFILALGSPVFHAMFYGTGQTGLYRDSNEVEIPDIEPTAFHELLRYLYCEEAAVEAETVMGILYASKKYMIPGLTKRCIEHLENELRPSNVCLVLKQSICCDEIELANKCLELMDVNTEEVFASDELLQLDLRTLELVLARDTLHIEEHLVFEAVDRWAETECTTQNIPVNPENKRTVLGEALYLVRMPLMTPEQFTKGPIESGLLSPEESVVVFANFFRDNKGTTSFPKHKRHGDDVMALRFDVLSDTVNWVCGEHRSDDTTFWVDKKVWMDGLGFYGPSLPDIELYSFLLIRNPFKESQNLVCAE